MITVTRETAFSWLWGISAINMVLGLVIWAWNSFALAVDDSMASWEELEAIAAQNMGASLWSFGVMALLISLATSAIVGGSQIVFRR